MNRLRIAVVVVDNDAIELDRRSLHFNLDSSKFASRATNYDVVVIYRPVHISFTQVSPVLCMGHSITTEQ
jgi:hypothetical protein